MTKCSQARRWFGAYWDDEVTQAEREWLESHFSACTDCRREYEEFARALEWVASLPRREAAPDLVERTLARARRSAPEPDRLRTPRPAWAPAMAAATTLVLVAALVAPWVAKGLRPAAPTTTPTAALAPDLARSGSPATGSVAVPVRTPTRASRGSEEATAALVDSLIDHSEDVNFVLDPVQVSRGRTASSQRLGPAKGQQAVITF